MKEKGIMGLLALFLFWTGYTQAATFTCEAHRMWPSRDSVFNLNGAISVGEDIPVGTVVFRATLVTDFMGMQCEASDESGIGKEIRFPSRVEVVNTFTSQVAGITSPPYGEKIYQTNVPGIGVSVFGEGKMPYEWTAASQTLHALNSGNAQGTSTTTYLKLIKTGPVSPGTVNALNFPHLQSSFITPTTPAGSDFIGFPLIYQKISYTGAIQIIKSTCQTEVSNRVVDLGSHDVKELKNSSSGVTAWKDASVRLIGCQFSPGFINDQNSGLFTQSSGDIQWHQRTLDANTVRLSLSSVTPLIDPINGVISVEESPVSATGVHIQVGVKEGSEIKPFNFSNNEVIFTPPKNTQSLEIPIFARYYSPENAPVTPGKANGAIVYTLNYY